MGWGKKKEPPPQPERPRTPGRSQAHRHAYTILVSDITNWDHLRRRPVRAVTRACTCGLTQTTGS